MMIHLDAETFPLMTEAELDELARDIATHGLRDPLKTDHTGEFLVDGRNRQRACERTGVAPRYEALPLDTDIFAYVISANLHRRHLTDAQRHETSSARSPTETPTRAIVRLLSWRAYRRIQ